jgi:hypothetical protein
MVVGRTRMLHLNKQTAPEVGTSNGYHLDYRFPFGPWTAGTARSTAHGPARHAGHRASAGTARGPVPCLGRRPGPWHGTGTGGTGRRAAQLPSPLAQRPLYISVSWLRLGFPVSSLDPSPSPPGSLTLSSMPAPALLR